jgi:hypothetical protein
MAEESQSRNVDRVETDTWHVVLDTNEMFGDFRLRHREIRFLLENAKLPTFRLCLPEVVIREMANHFRERWSEAQQRYESAQLDLERLIGRTISDKVQADEIRAAADRYESELRQELLHYGVHIEPIPTELAGVEKLLARDLGRLKPFGDRKITDETKNRRDRGGMRDALIWESVLAMCGRELRSLAFITDNVSDFGNAQGDLFHEDLLSDLAIIGLDRQNVRLYKTIRAFNDVHLRGVGSSAPDRVVAPGDLGEGTTRGGTDVSDQLGSSGAT